MDEEVTELRSGNHSTFVLKEKKCQMCFPSERNDIVCPACLAYL